MVSAEFDKYRNTISKERLLSFTENEDKDVNLEILLTRYKDNILISESFYPTLSTLEITLRNSIDTMMRTLVSESWVEDEVNQRSILHDYEHAKLKESYDKITSKYGTGELTRGKIIAELTFGFWVNLCSKKYNPTIWTKQGRFRGVFVNYPVNEQEQIHKISQRLNSIKRLRNRIFHYEPILKDDIKILTKYCEMVEILNYLPNDDSNVLNEVCRFKDIYNSMLNNKNLQTKT